MTTATMPGSKIGEPRFSYDLSYDLSYDPFPLQWDLDKDNINNLWKNINIIFYLL